MHIHVLTGLVQIGAGEVGAGELHVFDHSVDPHPGTIHGDAHRVVLTGNPPGPIAGFETAAGEEIDGGEGFRENDRLVIVDAHHSSTDFDRGRHCGRAHHGWDGRHHLWRVACCFGCSPWSEVMVGQMQAAIAEVFGLGDRIGPILWRGRRKRLNTETEGLGHCGTPGWTTQVTQKLTARYVPGCSRTVVVGRLTVSGSVRRHRCLSYHDQAVSGQPGLCGHIR